MEYRSLDAFYKADPRREHSPESDYGVWWRDAASRNWRVSWVEDTGEVYALRFTPEKVVVLGVVPASTAGCECGASFSRFHGPFCPAHPSAAVDAKLEGWAEICGQPGSLAWVEQRLGYAEAPHG